jgi:hypothetical protein
MMKIAVIACETFRLELDKVLGDDPDIVYKEYVEFGLHEYPKELRAALIEKVNAWEGKADVVLLGYGICQSLKDIENELRVPTIKLPVDDCVGALLTPEEYDRERKICAGTMFATPFFANWGKEWFEKDMKRKMKTDKLDFDIDYVLGLLFNGYERVLFVDTGVGDREELLRKSRRFASDLNLRHERRDGTLEVLKDSWRRVKEQGSNT